MDAHARISELEQRIELLQRENSALLRKVYGDCRDVVLTDEQHLAALLRTKTFRYTKGIREFVGKLGRTFYEFRGGQFRPTSST